MSKHITRGKNFEKAPRGCHIKPRPSRSIQLWYSTEKCYKFERRIRPRGRPFQPKQPKYWRNELFCAPISACWGANFFSFPQLFSTFFWLFLAFFLAFLTRFSAIFDVSPAFFHGFFGYFWRFFWLFLIFPRIFFYVFFSYFWRFFSVIFDVSLDFFDVFSVKIWTAASLACKKTEWVPVCQVKN